MKRRPIDEYVRDGLCPCCGHMPPIWTPEAIVQAAERFYVDEGRSPGQTDWMTAAPGHPTAGTVYRVFGSFENMLTAAGLPPINARRRRTPKWTRELIINALLDWVAREGHWPSSYEWQTDIEDDHPHYSTVINHFGSWAEAKRAAGWAEGMNPVPLRPHAVRGLAA